MDKYKYIISLGEDCFFRSLIDRYKIRDKFPVRMPFDGSTHPYTRVCQLIKDKFVDYMDNVIYEHNMFLDYSHGTSWNHEKTNDMNNFKEQIRKRVTQFEEILNSGEKIMFLIHYKRYDTDFDCTILKNALKESYPNLTYSVFVFNNYCTEYCKKILSEDTTYVNIFWNPPHKKYQNDINADFVEQMYITSYGIEFSKCVLKELCEVLNENPDKYIMDAGYIFNDNLK
jgi:hypothetical protein